MMVERLLLSQGEAAKALGVSPKTLRDQVKAGKLRFILIGKRRKFTVKDLEEFIEENRVAWPSIGMGRPVASRSRDIGFEEAVRRLAKKQPPSSRARRSQKQRPRPSM